MSFSTETSVTHEFTFCTDSVLKLFQVHVAPTVNPIIHYKKIIQNVSIIIQSIQVNMLISIINHRILSPCQSCSVVEFYMNPLYHSIIYAKN